MTLDTLLADPKNKAEDFKEIDLMYVDVIGYAARSSTKQVYTWPVKSNVLVHNRDTF